MIRNMVLIWILGGLLCNWYQYRRGLYHDNELGIILSEGIWMFLMSIIILGPINFMFVIDDLGERFDDRQKAKLFKKGRKGVLLIEHKREGKECV